VHGEPGSLHRVSCPAGCKTDEPRVFGTDTYAGLSRVCNSATHAGLISNEQGGEFTLILETLAPRSAAASANGIESRDWTQERRQLPTPALTACGPIAALHGYRGLIEMWSITPRGT